jgi:hypothetical protein
MACFAKRRQNKVTQLTFSIGATCRRTLSWRVPAVVAGADSWDRVSGN